MFSVIQSPTVYHTPPTQIHCAIPEELMIRWWCEFLRVQSRWHLKKPFKGVKPSSSYHWVGMEEGKHFSFPSLPLWDDIIFQCCKGHESKGMPYGSQGHWSCRATLPLNCCKGIDEEKAINTTPSFCSQEWVFFIQRLYGSLAFWTHNFNNNWWSLGHKSQHYDLCWKTLCTTGWWII